MIAPGTYYTVQGWMREDLGLKDKELTVYAIIYGFSQDGSSEYSGSARYLAEWIGCSRRTIVDVLASLVEKGYLSKKSFVQNGLTFCNYRAVRPELQPGAEISQGMQNLHTPCAEISHPPVKNLHTPCAEISHHNDRDNNRNINIDINNSGAEPAPPAPSPVEEKPKKPVKHKCGAFGHVLLSDKEYAKLEADYGTDMVIAAVKYLDEYIEEKGYKSKNHNLAIRRWVIDAVKERQQKKAQGYRPARNGQAAGPVGPNGIALDPTKTDLDAHF